MSDIFKAWVDKQWCVFGFPESKARVVMDNIAADCGNGIERKARDWISFTDGTYLRAIKSSYNLRGLKIGRLWVSKAVSTESPAWHELLLHYYGSPDKITWL